MRPSLRSLTACLLAAFAISLAAAQDATQVAARQKDAAAANMKKAGFARATIVPSKHFLIATTISEDKAKALGTALDRVAPLARKALKFDDKDEPWKGKLAIYYLPEGADFKTFVRAVVVSPPEGAHFSLRSEEPFIVDPAEGPANATDAEQFTKAAGIAAEAYLRARAAGAELPGWLTGGFGRVTALRAEGLTGRRYTAYRSAARALANKGGKPTELWSDSPPAGADTLANSFVEYLAYGPGAANFGKLIAALRPDENGNQPGVQAAFEAAGWKDLAMLESAWKKWAAAAR
jgi:hypothetical protein